MAFDASMEIPMIVEDVEPQSGKLEGNESEKTNSPKSRAKILPRYLRASPGSCHDFCKYGRKHAMEMKERIPIRAFLKARRSEQQVNRAGVSAERNLTFMVSSPHEDSETKKHDDPDTRKKEVSLSSKKETILLKEDLSCVEGLRGVSVEEYLDNPNSKPKQSSLAAQEIFETKDCKVSEVGSKTRRTSRSKELGISMLGERKPVVRPSVNLFPKRSLRKFSNIATQNSTKILNGDSHLKCQKKVESIDAKQINEDVPEKTLYVIESTIENTTLEPNQGDAHTTAQLSQSSLVTGRSPPPSSRRNSRPMGSRAQALRSPPYPSLGKPEANSKKTDFAFLQPLSPSLLGSPSDFKENGISSLDQSKAMEKKKKIVNSKAESKKTVNSKFERKNSGGRRGGILISESKSIPAQKLKFRRGTILDLKTENNATPRRLKFRQAKFIGENQKGKDHNQRGSISVKEVSIAEYNVGTKTKPKLISRNQNPKSITSGTTRRSMRNESGVGEGKLVGAKMNSAKVILRQPSVDATTIARRSFKRSKVVCEDLITKTKSERVVLRHQNVAEKKEVQSLFNNVIEETASKLVEARKSKVKALVGAFETVISLQDARPSATSGGA